MALSVLSFSSGLRLQDEIWHKFKATVTSPSLGPSSFFLVVAFGRCKFRLSVPSVASLLQATIGGEAAHFNVLQLGDRVFRFVVSSKPVGLFIYQLVSFECVSYKWSFHLWGNGGPNWRFEYNQFLAEEELSWSKA